MSMTDWAEREVAAACKRENPNWDGKSFDYGCACYQSALKAYKSLMEDEHSGTSFAFTRSILKNLLDDIPLSPITDADFGSNDTGITGGSDKIKSTIQCPRRYSLFKDVYYDGTVKYHDNDRAYCIDADCPSSTFSSGASRFLDDLYPITMPYTPTDKTYKVYVRNLLTDPSHGDFDVEIVLGYEDPQGNWHEHNQWKYWPDGFGPCIEVTDLSEKAALLNKCKNSSRKYAASRIVSRIVDEFATDELWEKDRDKFTQVREKCSDYLEKVYPTIESACEPLVKTDERGVCALNTWHNQRVLVSGDAAAREELIKNNCGLKNLVEVIDSVKKAIEVELSEE